MNDIQWLEFVLLRLPGRRQHSYEKFSFCASKGAYVQRSWDISSQVKEAVSVRIPCITQCLCNQDSDLLFWPRFISGQDSHGKGFKSSLDLEEIPRAKCFLFMRISLILTSRIIILTKLLSFGQLPSGMIYFCTWIFLKPAFWTTVLEAALDWAHSQLSQMRREQYHRTVQQRCP